MMELASHRDSESLAHYVGENKKMVRNNGFSYWRELSLVLAGSVLPVFIAVKLNSTVNSLKLQVEIEKTRLSR